MSKNELDIPAIKVVKGDASLCASIAAASVLAKVTRDRYMDDMGHSIPVRLLPGIRARTAAHLCRAARIRPVADPPPDVSEEDALSGTMLRSAATARRSRRNTCGKKGCRILAMNYRTRLGELE